MFPKLENMNKQSSSPTIHLQSCTKVYRAVQSSS